MPGVWGLAPVVKVGVLQICGILVETSSSR